MTTSSDARNPVELLAEEFLDRKRRGEQPTLREYLERYPDLAGEIHDLFPALLMVEDLGESSGDTTGSMAADHGAALGIRLEQLGDYRILREIGRGGMGVVYEAEQESLGRRVALKVLSAGSLLDPKQVRRFEREAKAAARLHHTNIVPVFGVGRQDGLHYFVMQFIAGLGLDVVLDDLRRLRRTKSEASPAAEPAVAARDSAGLTADVVARSLLTGRYAADGSVTEPFGDPMPSDSPMVPANGPLADSGSSTAMLPGSSELSALSDSDHRIYQSVARIGLQVAKALEYANRQGILHRDIKPSNLLLDNRGNVWVADFGLAKTAEADDLTHTGDILGTIRYMAPERFQGTCDARSDVYSLGLTLYELVALRPAFQGVDRHALMERVLHEEPVRLKKLAPGVPRDLETIIAKAIARDPAVRYATAAALAEDLQRFAEDRPIRARRVSAAERMVRWCRRNPWIAAAAGLAAAALVVVAVLALLYAGEQTRLAEARRLYAYQQIQHANEQTEAAATLQEALAQSNRRLTILHFERGRVACEQGQIGPGLVWMIESLRAATDAGDPAWRNAALASLSDWRRYDTGLKGIFTHEGAVATVAVSPDGKTVLTGSWDKTARLWDANTGLPIGKTLLHGSRVVAGAFHPDGKTVLTGSWDKTARLWDAATGLPIGKTLPHQGEVLAVAFSPDGKTILTGSWDQTARLWDATSGLPIGKPLPHQGGLAAVAFSPDGKTILTGSQDRTARLWDAVTSQPLGQPLEHPDGVVAVAFSPDGKAILTGCQDRAARLWDADTSQPIAKPLEHSGTVTAVAFSPDGKTILTGAGRYDTNGSDGSTRLWDATSGLPIGRPLEHRGAVHAVAFSPEGKSILVGSSDGRAQLWDATIDYPIGRPLEHRDMIFDAAFSSDGKTVLTGCRDGRARRWDADTGRPLGQPMEHTGWVIAVAFSPDGKTILTGGEDRTARLWDAASGRPVGRPMKHSRSLMSMAFSPDSQTILIVDDENTARLWDATTSLRIEIPMAHSGEVEVVTFSPDRMTIATVAEDGTVRLWNAATGLPIGTPMPHPAAVRSVMFSPDGKTILTGGLDKTARLWDAATCRPLGLPLRHPAMVVAVAFRPDGKTILTGCDDKTVRLWDVATGQPIAKPLEHPHKVVAVEFSPDGKTILTGDKTIITSNPAGTVRLWDTPVPLPDDLPRLAAWVETFTGLELDEQGALRVLDGAAWWQRRARLRQLGGPPPGGSTRSLDPILFGPDPTARARAWIQRNRWAEAEAALDEAVGARPLNRDVRTERGQFYLARLQPEKAAANFAEAVLLDPADLGARHDQLLTLLAAGDRDGVRRATADLLDRCGRTTNPDEANKVAWSCVLAPDVVADGEALVRLAENALKTLGAALYRAGRFDESIRRLEEGLPLRNGTNVPQAWAFLATAHFRLGHRTEAHRWLDRLRNHEPSRDPNQFWHELEIRLLRSEAEAVILYDPAFPADPFAH
jgi:WD40 repeat protein/serine/threonine protein kinase/tetratricopeptide (TPR) repeat protein